MAVRCDFRWARKGVLVLSMLAGLGRAWPMAGAVPALGSAATKDSTKDSTKVATGQATGAAVPTLGSPASSGGPGAELFTGSEILRILLELAPGELASLRQNPRNYVPATLREGTQVYQKVGVHLKGATGSFRSVDDKPALTVEFGRFVAGQRFHGLQKIHLNNSVEDPSYLNELLGGELFRTAGVPAPRVGHALVELNGRGLGLYVLKEGFSEEFLGLYFRNPKGRLYEPGTGHDAGEPMKVVLGERPGDSSDLDALAAAAREPDLRLRWQRLEKVLELDRFISFMAMEVMAGHRDGYCLARNNFRIYHDRDTDKLLFLPHGMDQLFGKSDAPWRPLMNGRVARAVMETPEGRRRYRERFTELLTNAYQVDVLSRRADETLKQLRPMLTSGAGAALAGAVAVVKERLVRRHRELERQLAAPELQPLLFTQDVAHITDWQTVDQPAGGLMERARSAEGKPALLIRAGPVTSASWRAKVLLVQGRYRFEGAARTQGVEPLEFGRNQGASLRVGGPVRGSAGHLTGDQAWKVLPVEFEVASSEAEVELSCELRARRGEAWFDLESLRLMRLPNVQPSRP